MKKITFIILFFLVSSKAFAHNYCSGDAEACWLFTEGNGTTVADSTGNGNTGTFQSSGHPAWQNASLPSRSYITSAVSFNSASTDQINCGSVKNLYPVDGTPFSFVGWFNTNNTGAQLDRIIDKSNDGTGPGILPAGTKDILFEVPGSSALEAFSVDSVYSTSTWTHLVVTWDGTTNYTGVKIYINGSLVSMNAGASTNGASLTSNSAYNFLIGSRNLDNTRVWDRYLTEMAVFDRVLSPSEVSDIYNNGLLQSNITIPLTQLNNAVINNAHLN